jgi:hypothetical protein
MLTKVILTGEISASRGNGGRDIWEWRILLHQQFAGPDSARHDAQMRRLEIW